MRRYAYLLLLSAALLSGCGRDVTMDNVALSDTKTADIIDTQLSEEQEIPPDAEVTPETTQEITDEKQTEETPADETTAKTKDTTASTDPTLLAERERFGVVAATGDFVTKGKVNVRSGPSTKYDILTVMDKDTHIPIIGVANTGWYQVRIQKQGEEIIAYMSNKWLDGEFEKEVVIAYTGYKPKSVVKKANSLAKEKGYTLIADDLEEQLLDNKISKETYEFLLPYGRSTFVTAPIAANFEDAATMDGTALTSIDEIAEYLVSRLLTDTDTCYTFDCAGSYWLGNKKYYEFRCYKY